MNWETQRPKTLRFIFYLGNNPSCTTAFIEQVSGQFAGGLPILLFWFEK
jgi:hypothetical protein